jgi:hypothetical protein
MADQQDSNEGRKRDSNRVRKQDSNKTQLGLSGTSKPSPGGCRTRREETHSKATNSGDSSQRLPPPLPLQPWCAPTTAYLTAVPTVTRTYECYPAIIAAKPSHHIYRT